MAGRGLAARDLAVRRGWGGGRKRGLPAELAGRAVDVTRKAAIAVAWLAVALLTGPAAAADGEFKLTILHTNDVHARYEQANAFGGTCDPTEVARNRCFAGVARRFTKINELRSRSSDSTLLLDAGDQYQGTFWFNVHRANITAHFMKKLGYDAMSLGNHEFDLGLSGLVPFLQDVSSKFPVLSCNIDVSQEPLMSSVKPFVNVTRAGRRIGIIGFTSPDTPFLTDSAGLGKLIFRNDIDSIQAAANELHRSGIDIIIALGHSGYDIDQTIAGIEHVDVVVGGHTHTFLYSGTPPSNDQPAGPYPTVVTKRSGAKALVVQDFFFGKYLGHLDVTFDDRGEIVSWSGAPILLNGSVPEDPGVLADVERYGQAVREAGKAVVGSSSVFLEGSREVCRARECNMGNAIADAFVAAQVASPNTSTNPQSGSEWSRISLAVVSSGGIRMPIPKGFITYADVFGVMPFQNTVDAVTLRGRDVRAMFEQSVANYAPDALTGSFLQVSGFKIVYHMYKKPYSRVASVKVRCQQCNIPLYEDLNDGRNYTILMPAFTANGGDNFTVIRDNQLKRDILGEVDSDLFIKYLKESSPLTTGLDQRIELVFAPSTPPACGAGRLAAVTATSNAHLLLCIAASCATVLLHKFSAYS